MESNINGQDDQAKYQEVENQIFDFLDNNYTPLSAKDLALRLHIDEEVTRFILSEFESKSFVQERDGCFRPTFVGQSYFRNKNSYKLGEKNE